MQMPTGTSLYDNVMNDVMNSFVTMTAVETFLAAVPIKPEDMTMDLHTKLGTFAVECMQDLGPYKLLQNAMKRTPKDSMGYAYLSSINSMAMEAAQTIADRVIEEHKGDADLDSIKKAAEKVSMTPDEVEKLKAGVSKAADEKLSETIQTKVLDVIKEERDAYTKDAELEQEIKEAVKQADPTTNPDDADMGDLDPGMSEETGIEPVESDGNAELTGNSEKVEASESAKYDKYMEGVLGHPNERTRHASVFSTIHEMALEAVLVTTEKYGENDLPTKTMSLITRRNTFDAFESYRRPNAMTALESLTRLSTMESMATPDTPTVQPDAQKHETALMVASIIYTFFETLNTMNLYCPGLDEVRKFVEENIPLSKMVDDDRERFMHDLTGIVSDAVYNVNKAKSVPEVAETRTDLEAVREACCSCKSLESDLPMIKQKLEPVIEQATLKIERLRQAAKDAANMAPAVESQMELMHRTRDTAKFSRMASSFGCKRNVNTIRFKIDPTGTAMGRKYVAMECMDASGAVTDRFDIVLEQNVTPESMPGYVSACIRGSKLNSLDKPIRLYDRKNSKLYDSINT